MLRRWFSSSGSTSASSSWAERQNLEIGGGHSIFAVAFYDARHMLSVDRQKGVVRRLRIGDGIQVGNEMNAGGEVWGITVSNDRKWIVASTDEGGVTVWDAETEQSAVKMKHKDEVRALDVSPDSTMVATGSMAVAVVWDIETGRRLFTLKHNDIVSAVKFSPDGTRIATSEDVCPIRIFDSRVDGKQLFQIREWINTNPLRPTKALEWSEDSQKLFLAFNGTITCIDASTGRHLSEWRAHEDSIYTHIQASRNKNLIVSWQRRSIAFWDASTGTKLGPAIEHKEDIQDVSLCPDTLSLAITCRPNTITVLNLRGTLPLFYPLDASSSTQGGLPAQQSPKGASPSPAKQSADLSLSSTASDAELPFLHVSGAALMPWIQGNLEKTEGVLTEALITTLSSSKPAHHALAHRALVRARLRKWVSAKDDAEKSLNIQLSVIGLIAKSIALVGLEERQEGFDVLELASTQCDANENKLLFLIKSIILCTVGEYGPAISRLTNLIGLTEDKSLYLLVQAQMFLLLGIRFVERGNNKAAIGAFEHAHAPSTFSQTPELQMISFIFGWHFDDLGITIQRHLCEALHAAGRAQDAVESLLRLVNDFGEEIRSKTPVMDWVTDFTQCCVAALERIGDEAAKSNQRTQALLQYKTALNLYPVDKSLFTKWVKVQLTNSSWKGAVSAAYEFELSRIAIYQTVCNVLEATERLPEAAECFHETKNDLGRTVPTGQDVEWSLDFERRLLEKLESRADTAAAELKYNEAIKLFSAAISFRPAVGHWASLLVKQSKVWASSGMWEDAVKDANDAINLDSSAYNGYEQKHAALLGARRYDEALEAYETMLSKLFQSSDPKIYQLHRRYARPSDIEAIIHSTAARTIRDSPHVLINTVTGRLCNKSQRVSAFTSSQVFKKLLASSTTKIDHNYIEEETKGFFKYTTLSHTWEDEEPLFRLVENTNVYTLPKSLTHHKLQQFCLITRAAGFMWAWSDTCCIDKRDPDVLRESIVAMFTWYRCSCLTLIFLRGVRSSSGSLLDSKWITRGWTYQEYVASNVVQFYTEDWTPYRNLTMFNHKEAPDIIFEMEKVAGTLVDFVHELQPGLDRMREKLCLAATRKTSRAEDAAYSLLGIFSVSIPVIYGEGEGTALGRLLGQLLTDSGDASILAWTGKSGSFNSCWPAHISMFHELPTSHLPSPLHGIQMDENVKSLLYSSLNTALVVNLYDHLSNLSAPSSHGPNRRMKLPCLMFQLGPLVLTTDTAQPGHCYRANTVALGKVTIQTSEEVPQTGSLYLVHPWIKALFDSDQEHSKNSSLSSTVENLQLTSPRVLVVRAPLRRTLLQRIPGLTGRPRTVLAPHLPGLDNFTQSSLSLPLPATTTPLEKRMQALRLVARLRQPFGALLLASSDGIEFRRVAADVLIKVQVKELHDSLLTHLIENVHTIDVL